ncbi:hypothetical protein QBC34DRAFT_29861 [Podospora aff. communis PSN243]|uniref:C2H2-type domain-containing protein n=1 Tax=Podospora aff. communis PSN243 TaxID=3040156 RepID=A0AAV9G494_9PEZI|nr:hypothetical protein QBC34DRAFT_29861 [Podospora aff. communis PSN243]
MQEHGMQPVERPQRHSFLPVPTTMKRSRLPLPKTAGAKPPSVPRTYRIKRPAADPPIEVRVISPLNGPSATKICTIRVLPKPPLDEKLSPLALRASGTSIHTHKHSHSADSAIGSSICGSSNYGDASDAIDAASIPVVPPLLPHTLDPRAELERATPPTPTAKKAEVDVGFVQESTTLVHDHATPPTIADDAVDGAPTVETVLGLLLVAIVVADSTLKQLLGLSFHTLEFRDKVVAVTTIYRKLLKGSKKDFYGGATPSQQPEENFSTPLADQEASSNQQHRRNGTAGSPSTNNSTQPRSLKRPLRPNDENSEGDADEGNRKGKKRLDPPREGSKRTGTGFSCPFRKLDPLTFNVREYAKCANNELVGMANVKRHLKDSHCLDGFPCDRCWKQFDSKEKRLLHHRQPESCPLLDPPPTEAYSRHGISISTRELLSSRRDDQKVDTWRRLWAVLFGDKEPVKDHGEFRADQTT